MELRRLGRTDLYVSALSLGTMTFGEQHTEREAFQQMDLAFDHGVNLMDTAELYAVPRKAETQGRSEQIVGNWMKARGNRDKIIVATKVVGRSELGWFRDDGSPTRLTAKQIEEAVERSLNVLQIDCIDLYQVHWPDRNVTAFGSNPTVYFAPEPALDETPIEETLDGLERVVKAGKVREIGVSNESPWGVMRYLHVSETQSKPRIVSIQNAYSLANRTFETGLAEIALREDVGLLIYSAMAWGVLSGKYLGGQKPASSRTAIIGDNPRYRKAGMEAAVRAYLALADKHGVDIGQLATSFAASRPFTASVILGASMLDQLRSSLTACEDVPITDELLKDINEIQLIHTNPAP